MTKPDLMTSAQAAEALGVSRPTLNRRVRSGAVPAAFRLTGKRGAWLFDPEVITRLQGEGVKK